MLNTNVGKKLLSLLCMLALLSPGLFAARAEGQTDPGYILITGRTHTMSDSGFVYSDLWLEGDSSHFSKDLCKVSVVLASAGYSNSAASMLSSMGYSEASYMNNAARTLTNNDRVAFTAGFRDIPGTNDRIWCVVVRGTAKNCEWLSNFKLFDRDALGNLIDNGDKHYGFHKAAEDVANYIDAALTGSAGKRNILWLTGHSRGAAVANILAGKYTKSLGAANVFAYTFACPAVDKNADTSMSNIFNINNSGDLVPMLPLQRWGYRRFGQNNDRTFAFGSSNYGDYFRTRFKAEMGSYYHGVNSGAGWSALTDTLFLSADEEDDFSDPLHYYAMMLVGYFLGGKEEVSVEDFVAYYAPQMALDFVKGKIVDYLKGAIGLSALEDADAVTSDSIALLQEGINNYSEDDEDFADFLSDNWDKFKRIAQIVGNDITEYADLSPALTFILKHSVTAYSIGEVIGAVNDVFDESRGGTPISAVDDAHHPDSYVLYLNAVYWGYKGLKGTGVDHVNFDNDDTTTIGDSCFMNTPLEYAHMKNVSYISANAFRNCQYMAEATYNGLLCYIGENAFRNCKALTEFELKDGISALGEYCFAESGVTAMEAPSTLPSIPRCCYYGCSELADAVIPDTVASLEACCFGDCPSLKSVTIPAHLLAGGNTGIDGTSPFYTSGDNESVKTINVENLRVTQGTDGVTPDMSNNSSSNACYQYSLPYLCRNALTSLTVDEGVTRIGDHAFDHCSALTEVNLPRSLVSIGSYAFWGTTGVSEMPALYEGFTTLGVGAFSNSGITSIALPSTVTVLPVGCFYGCAELEEAVIPDTILSLGNTCFSYCPKLRSVTIPAHLLAGGNTGIDGTSPFYTSGDNDAVKTINVESLRVTQGTDGVTPDMSNNSSSNACYQYSLPYLCRNALTSLTVDEGVTRIGDHAFDHCSALTEVNLPRSLVSIGSYAFWGTTGVSEMPALYEGFTTLGAGAFSNSGITSIALPSTVTALPVGCFYGCAELEEAVIPDTILTLGSTCFSYCPKLRSVTIPAHLLTGGNTGNDGTSPFYTSGDNESVKTINVENLRVTAGSDGVIPNMSNNAYSSTSYKYSLPYLCRNALTSLTVDEGVTRVGDYAFDDCAALAEIDLPGSLVSIGNNAFCGCAALTEIELPHSLVSIGSYAFWGTRSLSETLALYEGFTTLGVGAFSNSGITSIALPSTVTALPASCFYGCAELEEAVIPDTILSLGNTCFSYCPKLRSVTIPAHLLAGGNTGIDGASPFYTGGDDESVKTINVENLRVTKGTDGVTPDMNSNSSSSTSYKYSLPYLCRNALTSLTVDEGVTRIGNYAFDGCAALTEIDLPRSLVSIGSYAFWGTTGISEMPALYEGFTTLGAGAFSNSGITAIALPSTVTALPAGCFYGCAELEEAVIPDTILSLGSTCFSYCPKLRSVTIPAHLLTGGNTGNDGTSPFYTSGSNDAVKTIYVENLRVTKGTDGVIPNMSNNAYSSISSRYALPYLCRNALTSLTLDEGVVRVGDYAFDGCASLQSVRLPDSLQAIGNSAFRGLSNLAEPIRVPDTVASISYAAFSGLNLPLEVYPYSVGLSYAVNGGIAYTLLDYRTLTLPAALSAVEEAAFEDTPAEMVVFTGEGVSIGSRAFTGGAVRVIALPDGIGEIAEDAFQGCPVRLVLCGTDTSARAWAEGQGYAVQEP